MNPVRSAITLASVVLIAALTACSERPDPATPRVTGEPATAGPVVPDTGTASAVPDLGDPSRWKKTSDGKVRPTSGRVM